MAMPPPAAAPRILSREPLSIAGGACRTTRRNVTQRDGLIEIEIDRPAGACSFNALTLVIDGTAVDGPAPESTGFQRNARGNYIWSGQRGTLAFRYDGGPLDPTLVSQPGRFGLVEPECRGDGCLTQAGLQLPRLTLLTASKAPAKGAAAGSSSNQYSADIERYQVNKSGKLLYESQSKLVWMRCSLGQAWTGKTCEGAAKEFSFDEALQAAASLNKQGGYEGFTDWVLPSIEQLKTLRYCSKGMQVKSTRDSSNANAGEESCTNGSTQPATSPLAMPGTALGFYKSQSGSARSGNFAWGLDFKDGAATDCCGGYRSNRAYVRLVRAGQMPDTQAGATFEKLQIPLPQQAVLLASSQWAHDKLESEARKFVDWGAANGMAYSIQDIAPRPAAQPAPTSCAMDISELRKFIVSGAGEVWYRHGRADVDELSPIYVERTAWMGECRDGLAEGEGIVVFFYKGKIERNDTSGAVRALVKASRGQPVGDVFAYSNALTCFNSCQANGYAKVIGRLSATGAAIDLAKKDVQASAQRDNKAMGQLMGGLAAKAAEVLKTPPGGLPGTASPSATQPGSNGPWKIVRQYEGGFSEFGFDTRHTIFVVRCRSGAEHKLYRDKHGKWGNVGMGFNNSAPSLEMAASQKCN